MSPNSSFEDSADSNDTPLDLERAFRHPKGLPTARSLVRALMMAARSAKGVPPSQANVIPFSVSRPMPASNPAMPNVLKEILAFGDPQVPSPGDNSETKRHPPDMGDNAEKVERSHIELSTKAGPTLRERVSINGYASVVKQSDSMNQSYSAYPLSAGPALQRWPLTRGTSSGFLVNSTFGNRVEIDHQSQTELQPKGKSRSSLVPLPNTAIQSNDGQLLSSDLSSLDREFLGFYPPPKPSISIPLHDPSVARGPPHPNHLPYGRVQHSTLAPQTGETTNNSKQSPVITEPPIVNKSAEDCELLQVEETSMPVDSTPIFDTTILQPSSLEDPLLNQQIPDKKRMPKKRKMKVDGEPRAKKQKCDKANKAKRIPKLKIGKKELAKYQLDHVIWMRILEFTPPSFLGKARLICKEFKGLVDKFSSIYINCRKENFGYDMPPPPMGLTERQYSNLLGSKGCLEPGCSDKNASRTHWSWSKRWCWNCWKSKIEREDRVMKSRGNQYGRTTLTKMLECIPVGMHDSFMKPHDYVDDVELRPRGAPRLYKYYLTQDIDKIIAEYEALTPQAYVENPKHTPAEKAAALAAHQALMDALDDKRATFFASGKAENDAHMAQVQKIEAGIRMRREINRNPYDENRNARKELFSRRAREQLPHIDEDFVKGTKAFKAATRIFRDKGTERGWQTLKPKIVKEWEGSRPTDQSDLTRSVLSGVDFTDEVDEVDEDEIGSTQMEVDSDDAKSQVDALRPYAERARMSAMQEQAHISRIRQILLARHSFGIIGPIATSSTSLSSSSSGSMMNPSSNLQPLVSSMVRKTLSSLDSPMSISAPSSHRRTASSNGLLSSSLTYPTSDYQSSFAFLSQPSSITGTSNSNPAVASSTQISISSLLRPQTPATSPTNNFFT